MTLAVLRADSVDLPLFLHVLGAMLAVGAIATVATLAFASWRRPAPQAALLRRLAFATTLLAAWPAYILMRIAAQWVLSREPSVEEAEPTWVDIGFIVGDLGVVVLALITLLAWLSWRRTSPERCRPAAVPILAGLTSLFLAALAFAWVVMTAKPWT